MSNPVEMKSKPAIEASITRVFNAPVALVFEAWSKPALFARWFAPQGMECLVDEMDFRPGGKFRMAFKTGDGTLFPFSGEYREILPNQRIFWVSGFPESPVPDQMHTHVSFRELDKDRTEVHVYQVCTHVSPDVEPKLWGMRQGWNQTMDNLGTYLGEATGSGAATVLPRRATLNVLSDTEIEIVRSFDAPRALVFKAWTDPKLLVRWYGPRRFTMTRCEIDARVGGSYHYTLRDPDGTEFNWRGVYKELDPPGRMVLTEAFLLGDAWTNDLTNHVTLEEQQGRTTLRNHVVYASKADRDGHLGAGMEVGMNETLQRLDELILELDRQAMLKAFGMAG